MAHGCVELLVTKSSSEYPRVAKKIEPTQNASCMDNDNNLQTLGRHMLPAVPTAWTSGIVGAKCPHTDLD